MDIQYAKFVMFISNSDTADPRQPLQLNDPE